jgi:hypothetical protein
MSIKNIAIVALTVILTQAYADKESEQKNLKPRIVALTDMIDRRNGPAAHEN